MITNQQIKESGIRLFRLNDVEIWAGFYLNETIDFAVRKTGVSRDDLVENPKEILVNDWDELTITLIDEKYQPQYTYRNYLLKCFDEGVTFPCLWSTTEY